MKALLFVYLMTYGGALVSLFKPYYALLIYICFAVIRVDYLWPWSVPPGGNYSRIIALAMLAGWAARGFGHWRFGRARGVVAALIGFMGWSILGALLAENRGLALAFVEDVAKIVLPVLVGITVIDSVRKLQQLTWVILLSVGYLAYEFNLSYVQGYNRIREEGFGGLDNNGVAILLNSCVGLAIFFGLGARTWWQKALALGTAVLLVHGVFLSNSRGGILTLLVTGLISFLLIPKRATHYVLFGLILALGVRLAGEGVRDRFMTVFVSEDKRDGSLQDRKKLLSYALDSVGKRPILGVGPNHWTRTVRREYGIPDGKATQVHNLWVQFAAELGIPGVAMILSYYGLCVIRLLPIARGRAAAVGPEAGDLARMVIASLTGSVLGCSFVSVVGIEPPYYIALLGAGVLKLSSAAPANGDDPVFTTPEEPPRIPDGLRLET